MLVRSATIAALVAIIAPPAFAQTPDSNPTPRRVLVRTLQTRREFGDRNFTLRFRTEARGRVMADRDWQRRRDVENRVMERVRGRMNRIKVRQPLLRRRPFRSI